MLSSHKGIVLEFLQEMINVSYVSKMSHKVSVADFLFQKGKSYEILNDWSHHQRMKHLHFFFAFQHVSSFSYIYMRHISNDRDLVKRKLRYY